MLEESIPFEKVERRGLIVHLYYNRDVRRLEKLGQVLYHSKKHRYAQVYVNEVEANPLLEKLSKESYVKSVEICALKDLDTDFVGSLWRENEKVEKN